MCSPMYYTMHQPPFLSSSAKETAGSTSSPSLAMQNTRFWKTLMFYQMLKEAMSGRQGFEPGRSTADECEYWLGMGTDVGNGLQMGRRAL